MRTTRVFTVLFFALIVAVPLAAQDLASTTESRSSRLNPASRAQTIAGSTSDSTLAFGIKGGFNVANISVDTESFDSKVGLIVGGFVRRRVHEFFSVQPEVLFSQQGAKFRDETYSVNYLQIPVLAVASVEQPSVTPFILFGPAIGLKLSASAEGREFEREDIGDEVSGTDFGFVIGGGVEINQLLLEARYTVGLKDTAPDDDEVVKNRVFSILVGYRFR